MSDIEILISDLIAAGTAPSLVGRVAAALAGKPTRAAKQPYTAEFEAFWKAYPTDQNMSKLEAWQVWKKIGPEERELAMKAIEPFKAWIKTQADYRTIHACRFLSKKRFEGHAGAQLRLVVNKPEGIYVKRDSADWGLYAEAYKASRGKYPPTDRNGGWFFTGEVVPSLKVSGDSAG